MSEETIKTILAIPVIIFWRIPIYIVTHKATLIIAVIGIVVFGTIHAFSSANTPKMASGKPTPQYQVSVPDVKTAPYIVATSSRIYYTVKYIENKPGQSITLLDYFSYDSKMWKEQKTPLELTKKAYGEIKILTRQ